MWLFFTAAVALHATLRLMSSPLTQMVPHSTILLDSMSVTCAPVNSCAQAVVRPALQLCFIVLQVVQPDKFTLSLRLRTPLAQGWLHLSWHPTAARVAMGQPPMRGDVSEAFSFAAQVGWSGC
jgi:hypothetical protein